MFVIDVSMSNGFGSRCFWQTARHCCKRQLYAEERRDVGQEEQQAVPRTHSSSIRPLLSRPGTDVVDLLAAGEAPELRPCAVREGVAEVCTPGRRPSVDSNG